MQKSQENFRYKSGFVAAEKALGALNDMYNAMKAEIERRGGIDASQTFRGNFVDTTMVAGEYKLFFAAYTAEAAERFNRETEEVAVYE